MNPFERAYQLLYEAFGPQHWWPAETPFEVLVGAVLTQNTNWGNVEKALGNLRRQDLLDYEKLCVVPVSEVAGLIRPSGYYNLKAERLCNLFRLIGNEYGGDFASFLQADHVRLREQLLAVKGIGPETADSILLYACQQPCFVIDSYTHRVFSRHALVDEETDYHSIQERFTGSLPEEVSLYNEYHALIVRVAKEYCKKGTPVCTGCPLEPLFAER